MPDDLPLPGDLARRLRAEALDTLAEIHAARLVRPAADAPVRRRFTFGFALPLAVLRAVFSDPDARRAYLRTTGRQLAATAGVTLLVAAWRVPATGGLGAIVRFVAEIVAAFGIVEWIVSLLSRDHQAVLSARAAMLTGVVAEEAPSVPWVRLDVPALIRTARHKWNALMLIILVAAPLAWFAVLPIVGNALYTILFTAWCAYGLSVLAVARSPLAWGAPADDPWFLRRLADISKNWPRFWPLTLYMKLLRRFSAGLHSPAFYVEQMPAEAAGLMAAGTLARIPGFYTFFRPVLSVAATHMLNPARPATVYRQAGHSLGPMGDEPPRDVPMVGP